MEQNVKSSRACLFQFWTRRQPYSFDVSWFPNAGFGFDGFWADDPSGAELRSPPGEGKGFASDSAADPGGAELCSFAAVELSAPDCGVFAASSAANAGVTPSIRAAIRTKCFMGLTPSVSTTASTSNLDECSTDGKLFYNFRNRSFGSRLL